MAHLTDYLGGIACGFWEENKEVYGGTTFFSKRLLGVTEA